MTTTALRILVVEDDELFRLGLKVRLLKETEFEVIEAEDGESALEILQSSPIDIVLLDIGLPGIGGTETCYQIKRCRPDLPILVLTSHSQPMLIHRLIEAGVQGYCLKGLQAETLILAIRSVLMGASWWDTAATFQIRSIFKQRDFLPQEGKASLPEERSNDGAGTLTHREQEILVLIAQGQSNQQIAQLLSIAPGTVRVHVHTILHKLGVSNRTQAATLAFEMKLIGRNKFTPF